MTSDVMLSGGECTASAWQKQAALKERTHETGDKLRTIFCSMKGCFDVERRFVMKFKILIYDLSYKISVCM